MKKIFVVTMLAALALAGCRSEEPKQPPAKESANQAIQSAADKAHEMINKTATASQSMAEKAAEIKETARKAANDMSATVLKTNAQVMDKTTEPPQAQAPSEPHKE